MKRAAIAVLISVLPAGLCAGGGHMESRCYTGDGVTYTFEIYTGHADQWDSSKDDHPPLSPRKAMSSATEFMKPISPGDKMSGWKLSTVTLERLSEAPEHWIYMVHFSGMPKGVWNGPVPWFEVIVRMDGSIPKPIIEKNEGGTKKKP